MASDQLSRLRETNRQLAVHQKEYQAQMKRLKDDPYMDARVKAQKMQALASAAAQTMSATRDRVREDVETIKKRAQGQPIEVTDLARSRVQRALARGTEWLQIARFCAEQKDRAGLAALKEELKWETGLGAFDHRRASEIQTAIQSLEKPLMTAAEVRALDELAEVQGCENYIYTNIKTLEDHYSDEQTPMRTGHVKPIDQLYGWIGTKDNLQDSFHLQVNEPVVGSDVRSQNIARSVAREEAAKGA